MTTTDPPATLASWGEFAAAAPDLAAPGERHLDRGQGAALLATVRGAESAPRIHPVTVGIVDGGLFVFLLDSVKRRDLAEDGRYALHAAQDKAAPDEFSVRGRARLIPQTAGHQPQRYGADQRQYEVRGRPRRSARGHRYRGTGCS